MTEKIIGNLIIILISVALTLGVFRYMGYSARLMSIEEKVEELERDHAVLRTEHVELIVDHTCDPRYELHRK